MSDTTAAETLSFQAEVSKLLHLMVHSVYSEKEIFLRELISNASDACDKLRYEALTDDSLMAGDGDLKITIALDKDAKTLTIADNGIGMNREDLIENLGTIARSGTGAFLDKMTGDKAKDINLIGQFGVGFYSAFMVADKVSVLSKKAGEDKGHSWVSDGLGAYEIAEADKEDRGTTITLHMRDDADEYLEAMRLEGIIKTYSDHIGLPIIIKDVAKAGGEEGEKEDKQVNTASALWTRAKSDITDEQYKEFYHHAAHAFDDPWLTLHYKAEGTIEYTVLFFIPSTRPFDLFQPERAIHAKLYVKRVFITDDCESLLPPYLRFARGVVDSEDLSLNISREMLQNDPVLSKIKQGITKKILSELEKKAKKDEEGFATFWENFGAVLKEGIYEDFAMRDRILKLSQFATTKSSDKRVTLDQYIENMKEGQEAIYYITGEDLDKVARSPQIEGYKAKGIEVLLLTDPVDDFWTGMVPEYEGKKFKSVTQGAADLSDIKADDADTKDQDKPEATPENELNTLIALLKTNLGDKVKDVRSAEDRLTSSAVCLVAEEGDMDMHLARILKQHKQLEEASPRILEINPSHSLIKALAKKAGEDGAATALADAGELLLDQARIMEGDQVTDPVSFAERLAKVMEAAL